MSENRGEKIVFTAALVHTDAEDPMTDQKRQEIVVSRNQKVLLREDYACAGLLVTTEDGYELGELPEEISEEIRAKSEDLNGVKAVVSEILNTGAQKTVKIKVTL